MKNTLSISCLGLLFVMVIGCFPPRAVGWAYNKGDDIGHSSVIISDNVGYDLAWDDITSILTRKFDFDMISKESGYIRTKWRKDWVSQGKKIDNYEVRVIIKMSKQRKRVDIYAEAKKQVGSRWYDGYDTELLEQIKKDIIGMVGN